MEKDGSWGYAGQKNKEVDVIASARVEEGMLHPVQEEAGRRRNGDSVVPTWRKVGRAQEPRSLSEVTEEVSRV